MPRAFWTPFEWCSMPRAWKRKLVFAVPHHSAACSSDRAGTPVTSAVRSERPLTAVLGDLIEADGMRLDEVAVDPAALDHHVEHAGEQRGVAPRLHGQEQVACPRDRSNARILHDDLCALLARLPDVVRRDRRAFGDVRAGDPDDVGADHVRPRVRRPVDAERLLVGCAGAHHAQPSVVVDVGRLQTYPGELSEQIGLLGRQACAAQQAD